MGEWVKAAELQLELHRWLLSDFGRGWTNAWIEAEAARDTPGKADMYSFLAAAEPAKLLTADAIWVSPDMCDIVDVARETFKPESIEREDFITHTGFCYFAKPLYMLDRSKRTVSVGAISWCPVHFVHDPGHEPTPEEVFAFSSREQYEDRSERWGMSIAIFSSALAEKDDFSHQHRRAMREIGAPELVPLHYTVIEFGDTLDEGQLLDTEGNYTAADQWWKTIQATLRLMQQRVVVREDAQLPRATRRRWKREARHEPSEVMVIRLRRASHRTEPAEPSGRTLTHRHLRDSHWRDQWYPSIQRHRQIWIAPTIVGDENLPLVIKRRFYKWDR